MFWAVISLSVLAAACGVGGGGAGDSAYPLKLGAGATVPGGNASPVYIANAGMESGLPALYFPKNGGAGNSGALRFYARQGVTRAHSSKKQQKVTHVQISSG